MEKDSYTENLHAFSKEDFPNKERKLKSNRFGWVFIVVAVLILLAWLSSQIFSILMPTIQTALVVRDEMNDFIATKGFVAMDSVPITSDNTGGMHYVVETGNRVSQGAPVAEFFSSVESHQAKLGLMSVDNEIHQLETAQKIAQEGGEIDVFFKQRQEALYSWLESVAVGNYTELNDSKANVALASNKIQIITQDEENFAERLAELQEKRVSLEATAVPTGKINAPVTGYFVPSDHLDGYIHSRKELSSLSPLDINTRLSQDEEYYPANVVGHIITDYKWFFITTMSGDDAKRLKSTGSLQLLFTEYGGESVPLSVDNIIYNEDETLAKVELKCEYINAQILKLRAEDVHIILRTEKGLLVDKRALRIIDGQNGVYILFGSMVYFKHIDIVLENDFYYLVKDYSAETSGNWLLLYDTIVVDSGGKKLSDQQIL